MLVYLKRVDSTNPIFKNRSTTVIAGEFRDTIPVPDTVTLCNSCNRNVDQGCLMYVDKIHLDRNLPYDYYCDECSQKYFKDAVYVDEKNNK